MADTTIHNPTTTSNQDNPQFAVVNYVSKDGCTISMSNLERSLQGMADLTTEAMDLLAAGEPENARKLLEELLADVSDAIPNFEALPEEPDPFFEAEILLASAYRRAQEFLKTETERRSRARELKYAFAIPGYIGHAILTTLCPGASPDEYDEREAQLEALLDNYGWSLEKNLTNPAWIEGHCEPLRQLRELLDRHPGCPVTGHVLEAMEYAKRWCENTSYNYLSPISGKADGIAPEGVLYPRLSLELVRLERRLDMPKEWAGPLVKGEENVEACNEG